MSALHRRWPAAAVAPSLAPSLTTLAAALLLLTGCATTPPGSAPGEAPWTSGRMSLRVDATEERAAQGFTAGFELQGSAAQGTLRLLSPLGSRLAEAQWAPGMALLRTPEGERRFDSLDALAEGALGERLPLAALPDWLVGRPWHGAPHRDTPSGFVQAGWAVDRSALAEGRLVAQRESPPAVVLRIRLDGPAP